MYNKENFYILTGGPGSGKSTLLLELRQRGYDVVQESGRKVIREQIKHNGNALPWEDTAAYSQLMLKQATRDYKRYITSTNTCFFDRGVPDVLGYVSLIKGPSIATYEEAAANYRYNTDVFILPPWELIYENDAERKQDFQLAIATYEQMKKTYSSLGYNLIEVPKDVVAARATFILNYLYEKDSNF
ncbi:AAA family ATPase [Chitinophaga sp. Cy-1792]|uniref:AAA family ATPase n=1 Tax=Chitinophaga sp. Cy-1792 TaxID=2608339 RepID=UPI00141DC9DE|nr:AAA family ATPase [Chitinophaga sp. Cy-1792]NIG54757.1 AAA family ATPase [Chitinophaga sp. Cy-1792]